MAAIQQKLLFVAFLTLCCLLELKEASRGADRQGKFFSLFNVVQFDNSGCVSTSTISASASGTNRRNGTCYTSTQCKDKGGESAGNCAAGFGVCCVFIKDKSSTVNENCTYLQNPGYPTTYTETSAITYTIRRCSDCDDVCNLRLDFESFTTVGLADTLETGGGACTDKLEITSGNGANVPTICGKNTGQHMYVPMSPGDSNSVTLSFSFSGTSTIRTWEIKTTQIDCSNPMNPPNGCLQYFVGGVGRITTFNFMETAADKMGHLASHEYSACIRQEEGMCCVRYEACDEASSFTIDVEPNKIAAKAIQDSQCSADFIEIQASSSTCVSSGNLRNRYCGNFFSDYKEGVVNIGICDCTAPFAVGIRTDAAQDKEGTKDNTVLSRGVCLNYMQVACN